MSDDVVTNVWSGAKSEGEAADPSAVKDGALAFSEGVVIGLDLGTSNSTYSTTVQSCNRPARSHTLRGILLKTSF